MVRLCIVIVLTILSTSAFAGSVSTSTSLIQTIGTSTGEVTGLTTLRETATGTRSLLTPTSIRTSTYSRETDNTGSYGHNSRGSFQSFVVAVSTGRIGTQTGYTESEIEIYNGYNTDLYRRSETGTFIASEQVDLDGTVAITENEITEFGNEQIDESGGVNPVTVPLNEQGSLIGEVDLYPTFLTQNLNETGEYTYTDNSSVGGANSSVTHIYTASQSVYDIY